MARNSVPLSCKSDPQLFKVFHHPFAQRNPAIISRTREILIVCPWPLSKVNLFMCLVLGPLAVTFQTNSVLSKDFSPLKTALLGHFVKYWYLTYYFFTSTCNHQSVFVNSWGLAEDKDAGPGVKISKPSYKCKANPLNLNFFLLCQHSRY